MSEENSGKQEKKKMKLADHGRMRSLINASTIGMALVSSIFIGTFLGWWLDGVFGTKPYLTLFMMVMGIIAGFKNVIYFLKRSGIFKDEN